MGYKMKRTELGYTIDLTAKDRDAALAEVVRIAGIEIFVEPADDLKLFAAYTMNWDELFVWALSAKDAESFVRERFPHTGVDAIYECDGVPEGAEYAYNAYDVLGRDE